MLVLFFLKIQRESTKTKDITGGLPRVAELFEARKPANALKLLILQEQLNLVQKLVVQEELLLSQKMVEPSILTIPKGRYVIVNEGDYVRVGDPIMDGPTNPHDILRVLGIKAACCLYC